VLLERVFAAGRLALVRTGNGLVRSHEYDGAGRSIGTRTTDASGAIVEDTAIEYGTALAPPRQQIRVATTSSLASTVEEYGFELSGGLASEGRIGKRLVSWSDARGEERWYSWDLLSNRESDARGNDVAYNPERNRLLAASSDGGAPVDYAYDEAGFATLRAGLPLEWTATGRLAAHGGDTLEWDMRGGLIRSSDAEGALEFALFGGRIASDPASGALGLLEVGDVSLALGGGAQRYRHLDFRGNVSFASDESGAVVSHFHYGPFGVVAAFGAAGSPPAGGSRSFVDRASFGELMLLGDRAYDPEVGRFLSPDPVRNAVNNHAYTLGNPVWFADPDGRDTLETAQAIGDAATFFLGVALVLTPAGPYFGLILALSIAVSGFMAALSIAVAVTRRKQGDSGGGIAVPSGVGMASCSPRSIRATPDLARWLYLFVPLQIGLALLLLGRRRSSAWG